MEIGGKDLLWRRAPNDKKILVLREEHRKKSPGYVLFWMDGCGPCAALKPKFLEKLSAAPLFTVNINALGDDLREVLATLRFEGVPHIAAVLPNGEITNTVPGQTLAMSIPEKVPTYIVKALIN